VSIRLANSPVAQRHNAWIRFEIFLTEVAVIVVATFGLCLLLPLVWIWYFNSPLLLPFGIAATAIIFASLRRRTRKHYLEYELSRYSEAGKRRRGLTGIWRLVLWLPSALALLMLIFFPVGSHILHPDGHYLRYYRIPIPLTWVVLDQWVSASEQSWVTVAPSGDGISRFGLTTLRREQPVSIMGFMSSDQPYDPDFQEWTRSGAVNISRMVLRGRIPLICWQFVPRLEQALWEIRRLLPDNAEVWKADCMTPQNAKHHFAATFIGREEDLPKFYDVVQHVMPY
jgi:hypothetical protein